MALSCPRGWWIQRRHDGGPAQQPKRSWFLGERYLMQRQKPAGSADFPALEQCVLRSKARRVALGSGYHRKSKSVHAAAEYTSYGSAAADARQGRYQPVGECLVYPPFPRSRKPKGIIIFLGGAFIGASPEITYSHFIELLAKEGFMVVAAPYNVTFDHAVLAHDIHRKCNATLSILYSYGLYGLAPDELSALPVYCVGHSNGALMQVLVGSLCTKDPGKLPKANAIISFNNKPAADAVPFFDQMGPTLQRALPLVMSSPLTNIAANFAADAVKAIQKNSTPLPSGVNIDDVQSVQRFFEQIPGVFGQVTNGVSEFTPTPSENRATVALQYAVPNNLLIKFTVDSLDESDFLEAPLKRRSDLLGGSFKKLILTGTHATPLAQDPKYEVGSVFSPIDAVAQAVRYAALADLRILAKLTADWFESLA